MIYFATLHDTLRIGRIAGAGRDMLTPPNTPSPSQPVLALDNVVLTTPHPGMPQPGETRMKQTRNPFDNVAGRSWCAAALGGAGTARYGDAAVRSLAEI